MADSHMWNTGTSSVWHSTAQLSIVRRCISLSLTHTHTHTHQLSVYGNLSVYEPCAYPVSISGSAQADCIEAGLVGQAAKGQSREGAIQCGRALAGSISAEVGGTHCGTLSSTRAGAIGGGKRGSIGDCGHWRITRDGTWTDGCTPVVPAW